MKRLRPILKKTRLRTRIALGIIAVLLPIAMFRLISGAFSATPIPYVIWRMDEAQGSTVNDSTANANSGTITNALWRTKNNCFLENCLYFDGSGDYVSRADDADFDFAAASSFSMSGWFKHAPKTSGTDVLFSKVGTAAATGSTTTTTIATSTDEGTSDLTSWSNRVFFDPINDRWHVVYIDDGGDMHTQSTAASSGTSWTDGGVDINVTNATLDYNDFDCALETDSGTTTYLHCTNTEGADHFIYYRRCTLTGVNPYISCDTEQIPSSFGNTTSDYSSPHIIVDSNDCVILTMNLEFDSAVDADEHRMMLRKEPATCGDGVWVEDAGTVIIDFVDSAGATGANVDMPNGLKWFGDLDAQVYFVQTDTTTDADLQTILFDGDTDTMGTLQTLDGDVEFATNHVEYDSVIIGNTNVTFGLDDGTTDLDAYIITSRNGSLGSQVDTNLNVDGTTANLSGLVTAVVDTNAAGGDNIWVFASVNGANDDISYNTSTDGGTTWGGSGTLWVNSADTTEVKYLSAAYNSENCDIMVSWLGNDTTPWNVRTKIINTGSCPAAGAGYTTQMESDGDLTFEVTDGTNTDSISSTAATYDDNQWHQYLVTKNGTTSISLYIDGQQVATDTSLATTGTLENSGTFYMGIDNDGTSNPYTGFLDEFRLYREDLSSAEAKSEFNNASALRVAPDTQDVTTSGLVGYWEFDDTSPLTDSSGIGTTLTNNGTTTFTDAKFGTAGDMNGTSQYFEAADNATISITGSLTLSAWINNDDTTGSQNIIGKWDGTNNSYLLALEGDELRMYIDSATNHQTTTAADIGSNTFTHVAGVYDANTQTVRLFVNGVEQASTTTGGTIPSSIGDDAGEVVIGADDSAANYFDGHIDEARIYNRAFTAAEIRTLYNWSAPSVGYWKFDDNSGSTAVDSSGNAYAATLTNSPLWGAGKLGSGLNINGTSQYAIYNDTGTTKLDRAGHFSVEAWVKFNDLSTQNQIIALKSTTNGTNTNWHLMTGYTSGSTTDEIEAGFWNGTGSVVQTTAANLTTNTWYHIAATFDDVANTITIYVNGAVAGLSTTATETPSAAGDGELYMGDDAAIGWSGNPVNGTIDDIKFYNYPRTQAQVLEDMNADHPIGGSPVASQIMYWRMDEQQGTTINNSGNGGSTQNGTASGTLWLNSVTCKVNACLHFDGQGDSVSAGDVAFTDSLTGFSTSFWVYPQTLTTDDSLISKSDLTNTNNGFLVRTDSSSSDEIRVYIGDNTDTSDYFLTSNLDLVNTGWQHITVVYDGAAAASNRVKVYKNGREVAGSVTGTLPTSMDAATTAALRVGDSDVSGSEGLIAYFDEVKIYNTALTTDQVKIEATFGSANAVSVGTDERATITGGGGTYPLGWWKLDENTGTSAADIGTNQATAMSFTSSPIWTGGAIGQALAFDGVDDYLTVADDNDLDVIEGGDFTITGWFNRNNGTNTDVIVSKRQGDSSGAAGYSILIRTADTFVCDMGESAGDGSGEFEIVTTNTYSTPGWHHFACVFDDGVLANNKVYIDGLEVTTTNSGQTALTNIGSLANTQPFRIGANALNADFFDGKIDDIKFFNYVLTGDQIQYDYYRGAAVAWWKMDECTGTTINNAGIATGINGTLTLGAGGTTTSGTCTTSGAWFNGASGRFNSGMDFDGSDDYITVSDSSYIDMDDTQDRSFSIWVNRDTFTTDDTILSKFNGTTTGYSLAIDDATDQVGFSIADGSDQYSLVSTQTITSAGWNHIVVVWDDDSESNTKMYLNGQEIAVTKTGTFANIGNAGVGNAFLLGDLTTSATAPFDGKIDDARVFTYVLSAAQIKALYNQGGSVRYGPEAGLP